MTFSRRGREKKGWKAFQVDYDYVFSLRTRLCSYCLSDQQVSAILSMAEYLSWATRWVSEGEIDTDLIASFTSGLERNLMSGCCDDQMPIQYRYTAEGILERSENGGGSWTPAPEYDPRVYSPTFPPMAGDDSNDKRCIAATGMAALIKEQIGDQLTDDMSRYTLSQLIKDWVGTMIQSSNPFEALIVVATNQIFALVLAVLIPALTDPVYDTLKCIFYCRMADDASFTQAQLESVTSDIGDQIGGIATLFLQQLVNLLGPKGLTNLARAGGAAEGDCDDCTECQACSQRWVIFGSSPTHGTIIDQTDEYVEVLGGLPGNGNCYAMIRTADENVCCTVDHIEVIGDVGATSHVQGWTDCGTVPVEGAPQHVGLGWGTCINYFHFQSDAQFTVRVYFVDCP